MEYRVLLAGKPRPRFLAVGVTGLLLIVFSAGFVVGPAVAFGMFFLLSSLAVALSAGVRCGGLLTAHFAVFSAVCWRAVFPPLVGLLRWDDAAQYTTLRWNSLYFSPMGELARGIELGVVYGLLTALVLGTAGYGLGALYRKLRRDDPTTHPYVEA